MPKVLLTGATGFVGRHLYPALEAEGHEVRCASRHPGRAREGSPDREWVRFDVDEPSTMAAALAGCDAAFYLVHGVSGDQDYPRREADAAEAFARAARDAQVPRIVYLGGVQPKGAPSRHLASRLKVGQILRAGVPGAVELRAAMIIGAGSASWQVVRDLAKRLPAMILPRWLRNHSWPVAIDDVVVALVGALGPGPGGWYDLPGPERVSHRELLARTRRLLGHWSPLRLDFPLLTPRLSSYWIGLVTDVDLDLAQELVEGLRYDLDPTGEVIWDRLDHAPMDIDTAIRLAIEDACADRLPAQRMARAVARRAP